MDSRLPSVVKGLEGCNGNENEPTPVVVPPMPVLGFDQRSRKNEILRIT